MLTFRHYPLGDDQRGLLVNDTTEIICDSIQEVKQTMAKLDTAAAVVRRVQQLAEPMDGSPDVFQEFWDVVNTEGAFTDEELEPLGITAARLGECITALENFNKLMDGEAPASANYRGTVNLVRRVTI